MFSRFAKSFSTVAAAAAVARAAPRFAPTAAVGAAAVFSAAAAVTVAACDAKPEELSPEQLVSDASSATATVFPYSAVLRKPGGFEKLLRDTVRAYPDFPIPGILFQDIFPLFQNPAIVQAFVTLLSLHIQARFGQVDAVVGLDSRGFLFGPMLAERLGCAFVPIRKKGKLPGKVISAEYVKEYGTDVFEMQEDALKKGARVVVVDDLMATGGTMSAAVQLLGKAGSNTLGCFTLIELYELEGYKKVEAPCFTLLRY